MPQVLPQVPTFAERLGGRLEQAIGQGIQGYKQHKRTLADQKVLEAIGSNPNSSAMDYITGFSKLSPEAQKTYTPIIQSLLNNQGRADAQRVKVEGKAAEKAAEKEELTQGLNQSLDWLENNVSYTGSQWVPYSDSERTREWSTDREAVQIRKEYDTTGFWAADQVYTHFNKGQISEAKLKVIKNDLSPRGDLSERENKARIASLRRISNLPSDASKEKVDKVIDAEVKKVSSKPTEKVAKGTKITSDIATKLLEESGGDKEKARAKARNMGYEF